MRISDWSSDVCSSDLEYADIVLSNQVLEHVDSPQGYLEEARRLMKPDGVLLLSTHGYWFYHPTPNDYWRWTSAGLRKTMEASGFEIVEFTGIMGLISSGLQLFQDGRSEEHTSELQSLMRISYAVFCLKKKK